MHTRFLAIFLVAAVAGLALAACDDDSSTPDGGKPTSAGSPANGIPSPSGQPSEITTTLGVVSAAGDADGQHNVEIVASGVGEPGIGAWTLNVRYDPAVLSVVDCPSEGTQVCNPEFEDDALRFAGAAAEGLQGEVVLGRITFQCESTGTTAIEIELELLADGTIGDPRDIESATISAEGSEINCA